MKQDYSKEELSQQYNLKLIWAVKSKAVEKVKDLLAKGINLEVKDEHQCSALMYAGMEGNLEIAKLLIEAGANINAQRFLSSSVLMLTIDKGHLDVVTLLLEKGVDFAWVNQYGQNALAAAAKGGNLRIVKKILDIKTDKDRSVELDIALCEAAGSNQGAAIKMLIAAGADVNGSRSETFYPALLRAAVHDSRRATEVLLSLGAEVDYRNREGQTALMMAAEFGQEHIAEMLIKAGADVNATDNKGKAVIKFGRYPLVIEVLLNAGAKGRRPPTRKRKLPD